MSGVRMWHFLKDRWKFFQIHQYSTMALTLLCECNPRGGGGGIRFGSDGGVPLKPPNPYPSLTLIRPGGGWNPPPPSTFRAIILRNFFSAHRAFATFFFRVLRNFWCYFSEKLGENVPEVYATLCNRASAQNMGIFWICVQKNMENGFWC